MAPVYFQYGDALLEQVLEATMGSAEEVDHDEAEAEAKASTVQSSSAAASEPVPAATGVDLEQSDIEELLEISWECLEPARIIYEKYSVGASPAAVANRARLASVLCRLGQVQQLSGGSARWWHARVQASRGARAGATRWLWLVARSPGCWDGRV